VALCVSAVPATNFIGIGSAYRAALLLRKIELLVTESYRISG
jgi:hypothetical protein